MPETLVMTKKILVTCTECLENPQCDNCNRKIEFFPYRQILIHDRDRHPKVLNFHYFYPCWDPEFFINNYVNYEIVSAGFTYDEDSLPNSKILRNLSRNIDLWVT